MRTSSRSLIAFAVVLLVPTAVRGQSPTAAQGNASNGRGLVVRWVPDVMPLARSTPATDYAQRHYAQRIALTIGINRYSGQPWPRLHAGVSDARRMATVFRAMGFDRVESLEDEVASREGILDMLESKLPLTIGDGDMLVVFFAGHGGTSRGHGYIVPHDGASDLERTGISLQRLKESVLRMRVRHTVFLMDACFSGGMLRRAEIEEIEKTDKLAYWEAAAQDRVVQILTAGKADEMVQENDGWGLFTRAMYTGLVGAADRNHDGVVTTEELAVHTNEQVLRDGQGHQHPQWGTMNGSGTALFLDVRRLPRITQPGATRPRAIIRGLERPLARIHGLMKHRNWSQAERLLRDLLVEHTDAELRLLLAEVYIEADTLGNATLIDTELRHVTEGEATVEQQQRMLDLRARLEKARRGPM